MRDNAGCSCSCLGTVLLTVLFAVAGLYLMSIAVSIVFYILIAFVFLAMVIGGAKILQWLLGK